MKDITYLDTIALLKDELTAIRDKLMAEIAKSDQLQAENATLKALLRKADAELTSWMYHGHGSKNSGYGSAPLLNRIRDTLGEKL